MLHFTQGNTMSHLSSSDNSQLPLIVGIDWGDREHVACFIDERQKAVIQTFQHDPEAIAEWIARLKHRFPNRLLQIAIEQSRGALVHALQGMECVELYPINPKQLARFREAVYPSGKKSDPGDAELIARFLLNHRDQLRRWQPDDAQTRKLAYLAQLRRKLVDERTSLGLRLLGTLKLYFPLIMTLFGSTMTNQLVLELLKRWPSLSELKKAHPKALRDFFKRHGVTNADRQTTLIKSIRSATPLTEDSAIIETHTPYVQVIAGQILYLNQAVAEFDNKLRAALTAHPDDQVFRSVPGAGDVLIPRIIAAFGSDRERYQSAEEVQNRSGIAPLTKESGQSRTVSKRIACPKFLRQTFHEFADQARRWSAWSRAFYDLKKSQGMKHQAAVRALAFKWIRILFRLWKTRTTYSEAKYIENLKEKNSPILAFLGKTES